MSDEMQPLINLGKRLRDESKEEGLELIRFLVQPSLDGDAHAASAVFAIDESLEEDVANKAENDPEFDAMVEAQLRAEQEAKAEQARKRLIEMDQKLRDPSKGLGFDEE